MKDGVKPYLRGRSRTTVVIITSILGIALAQPAPSLGSGCKAVHVQGNVVPVSVHKMHCSRARRIARRFVLRNRKPKGWRATNQAGCEWILFPSRYDLDSPRFFSGAQYLTTVRQQGCSD